MLRRSFITLLALSAFALAPSRAQQGTYQDEAERLSALLNWQPGNVVAEIGAGDGQMDVVAARHVGEAGRVYATELDTKRVATLEDLASKDKTITVVKAAESETNLAPESCDSIFMRLVYHHLTKPAEIDASLFRALKPEGLLAIIDQEPPSGSTVVEGVPKNRVGHGVPQKILIDELTTAGFQFVAAHVDWPNNNYCVVFRKPKP